MKTALNIALSAILAGLIGCGGTSQPGEQKVAKSVQHSTQKRIDQNPGRYGIKPGSTVTRVQCSKTADRTFQCVGELDHDQGTFSSTVHISEDGKRFVTDE